jgi:hypothetical protein
MGPLPLSVCISVYICRVCVWYNVVGKDPRCNHYHFLCALGPKMGTLTSLCVCSSVYICSVCVLYNVIGKGPI